MMEQNSGPLENSQTRSKGSFYSGRFFKQSSIHNGSLGETPEFRSPNDDPTFEEDPTIRATYKGKDHKWSTTNSPHPALLIGPHLGSWPICVAQNKTTKRIALPVLHILFLFPT